jgi:hypothetical protein
MAVRPSAKALANKMIHKRVKLSGLFGLLSLLTLLIGTASAHPADDFVQASYLTLTEEAIIVDVELAPGVMVAPDILAMIDTDSSGDIAEAEAQAFVEAITGELHLSADDTPLTLTLDDVEYSPYDLLMAGDGMIQLHLSAPLPGLEPGDYQVFYENTYAVPDISNSYLVNGFILRDDLDHFDIVDQERDYYQHTLLLSYTQLVHDTTAAVVSDEQVETDADVTETLHEHEAELHADDVLHLLEPDHLPVVISVAIETAQVVSRYLP